MKRLDVAVYERKITESRTMAQTLIAGGAVSVDGRIVTKSSEKVSDTSHIELVGELPRYVGRGGFKLETALREFGIDLDNCVCLDIGASTGGFTDCMLQNGAKRVYAVDVGSNQLHDKLKNDERVISLEKTDIRQATIPELADFISVDVSFISLKLVIPVLGRFLKPGGSVCVLIKPQFEIGKKHLKNGVVRDKKIQAEIVSDINTFIITSGYEIIGTVNSCIAGADGNEELLTYFTNPCKREQWRNN